MTGQLELAIGDEEHDAGVGVVFERGPVSAGQPDRVGVIGAENLAAGAEPAGAPPAGEVDPGLVAVRWGSGTAGGAADLPAAAVVLLDADELEVGAVSAVVFERHGVEAAVVAGALFE